VRQQTATKDRNGCLRFLTANVTLHTVFADGLFRPSLLVATWVPVPGLLGPSFLVVRGAAPPSAPAAFTVNRDAHPMIARAWLYAETACATSSPRCLSQSGKPRRRWTAPGLLYLDTAGRPRAFRCGLIDNQVQPTSEISSGNGHQLPDFRCRRRYCEVGEWTNLSPATRKQRENILVHVLETAGDQSFSKITKPTIIAGCERRSKTPAQARHFLSTMRGLFRWAKRAGLSKIDPTNGVERPRPKKTDGFIPWTEEHVEAYENCWPIGTRQRVWIDVLLYTGLRRETRCASAGNM